ncbi:MAG: threonylcarbamoyl-AMP synthase [Acidobacteria bacterium]|jgi:L-threonylcarbamoyladenylate synthase|nr:MAG: threonylcarbamoyl-AMP synthase [Acidobacteriota bacterium]
MKVIELSSNGVEEASKILAKGGIVCFPTDTIYGLLASALNREAVERLYTFRRPSNRPFLLLLPSVDWLEPLELLVGREQRLLLSEFNATFIFYKRNSIPLYITRGRRSLAVRIPPKDSSIFELLQKLGEPLVAPSVNPEGEKPATNIGEAMAYFGELVDLYVDGGKRTGKPSTLLRAIYPHGLRLIREGNIPFKDILGRYLELRSASS